jgi:hypothetical protein
MAQKVALCIGINDYPGTGSDLNGCVNDSEDWSKALEEKGFTVTTLLDKQATRANIMDSMKKILQAAQSGDSVIFQYSGHGSYVPDADGDEPDSRDECICPHDIFTNGPITDDELFDLYSMRPANVKLVVISDSCHSGTVARFAPVQTPPSIKGTKAPERKVRFLPPSTFLPDQETQKFGIGRGIRKSSPPGRYASLLMAGCQDVEFSYDAYFEGRPNGAFSFVALDTLKKLNKEATYLDWYKAIKKVLPSQQYPQSPNLFGSTQMKKWGVFS